MTLLVCFVFFGSDTPRDGVSRPNGAYTGSNTPLLENWQRLAQRVRQHFVLPVTPRQLLVVFFMLFILGRQK